MKVQEGVAAAVEEGIEVLIRPFFAVVLLEQLFLIRLLPGITKKAGRNLLEKREFLSVTVQLFPMKVEHNLNHCLLTPGASRVSGRMDLFFFG